MTSILPTIAAKSDQMNAEDLIGGPRTIFVTDVTVKTSEDQPVWIHFKGDEKKPFKPCKTMRRLMVKVWGDDSSTYAGRAMTLYLDPEVKYGGMKVGGIRISHMSDMPKEQSFYLTETRGKKRQHTVRPLQRPKLATEGDTPSHDPEALSTAIFGLSCAPTVEDLAKVWAAHKEFHKLPEFVRAKDQRKAELAEGDGDNF